MGANKKKARRTHCGEMGEALATRNRKKKTVGGFIFYKKGT